MSALFLRAPKERVKKYPNYLKCLKNGVYLISGSPALPESLSLHFYVLDA